MPDWTNEQKDAIDRRNCDLLVSAAAGSGKTAVLSERVLKRVTGENSVRVDKLLIVTFTEAAASEMRTRIVDKLRAELIKNPENTEVARQLALVPKANITTIHSFCLNIIKSNFHLVDMDPGFTIIDDAEKGLMCTEAAIETINKMYETEGKDFSTVALWLAGGKDEVLAQHILKVYNYIQSFENPLQWLERHIEEYNVATEKIDELPWINLLKQKMRIELSGIISGYNEVLKYADISGSAAHYEIYSTELRSIEAFSAACNGSWQDIYQAASACNFPTVRSDKEADPELAAFAKKLRDDYKKMCNKLVKSVKTITENNAVQSIKKAYGLLKTFKKSVVLFSEIYSEKKREKNYIDFNDFEHIALKLLQDENLPVASALRDKYDEIYVDEYQDCNGVQEAIFSAISRKQNGKSNNMFMVGDIKQSIYKFRQADPEIFRDKLASYKYTGLQSKIILNKNFRSRREIINCVNSVFSKIMNKSICGVEYGDDERLCYGDGYEKIKTDKPICDGKPEIVLVNREENKEDITPVGMETRAVAEKIRNMVGKYYVYEAKTESYRPLEYRDCAILIRSPGSNINYIEEELKNYGIPYFSDRGAGLFDVHETELLVSALNITDNPLQDIPLIGFMRSVPGGFTENELFEIRAYCKKGYFYNAVKKCAKGEIELSEKCDKFLLMLKLWRETAKTHSVYGLIEKIMEDISFLAYIQTLPGGKARLANIELFCEYAKRYEGSSLKGIFNFLRYIEKLQKGKGFDTAKVLSEACNVVRVMSIHKSKGLEFPVVFILKGAGEFNTKDRSGRLIMHKEHGIGCDFLDMEKRIRYPLVSKEAISYKIMLDDLAEEMRVLYVAMTRAREKLFFMVSDKKAKEKIESRFEKESNIPDSFYDVQKASSYFEWILLSLSSNEEKCAWKITEVTPETAETVKNEVTPQKTMSVDASVKEEIKNRLFYTYPYAKSTALSSKYSVTELKNRFNSMDEQNNFVIYREEPLPNFMKEERLSAAAKGTILHLMLKFVDINDGDYTLSVEKCKKHLIQNKFISEKEAEAVDLSVVTDFLKSDICNEMRKSDTLYREIPFNICVGGDVPTGDSDLKNDSVLLQGIIDCLYVKNGKFYIVDYKTDNGRNTVEELENIYRPQLRMYRVAAEKITDCRFGGAYLYLLNRGILREVSDIDK